MKAKQKKKKNDAKLKESPFYSKQKKIFLKTLLLFCMSEYGRLYIFPFSK